MVRYAPAQWRPLSSTQPARMSSHDIVCLHTMVGSLWGTDDYFHRDGYGGTESHFGVGYDGQTLQWVELTSRADANYEGNGRVISIETADVGDGFPSWNTGDGSAVPAWRPEQLDRLAHLVAWLCSRAAHVDCPSSWRCHLEGIPLEAVRDSLPGRRGIGWHRQGVESRPPYQPGYRVPNGERWSTSTGKVCPGSRRIAQIPGIIEAARRIAAGTPPAEDDDMTPEQLTELVNRTAGAVFALVRDLMPRAFDAALTGGGNRVYGPATPDLIGDPTGNTHYTEGGFGASGWDLAGGPFAHLTGAAIVDPRLRVRTADSRAQYVVTGGRREWIVDEADVIRRGVEHLPVLIVSPQLLASFELVGEDAPAGA